MLLHQPVCSAGASGVLSIPLGAGVDGSSCFGVCSDASSEPPRRRYRAQTHTHTTVTRPPEMPLRRCATHMITTLLKCESKECQEFPSSVWFATTTRLAADQYSNCTSAIINDRLPFGHRNTGRQPALSAGGHMSPARVSHLCSAHLHWPAPKPYPGTASSSGWVNELGQRGPMPNHSLKYDGGAKPTRTLSGPAMRPKFSLISATGRFAVFVIPSLRFASDASLSALTAFN